MCAPNRRIMEEPSIQRFSSQSSGGTTLLGSDDTPVSPIEGTWVANERTSGANPVFQTIDSTPWIRLDALHPKLLQELQREYSVPEWNLKRPRSIGASKVKAWVRQSSAGVVLRLRQKINESRDEVIDAELRPIPGVSELPVNGLKAQNRIVDAEPNQAELPNNVLFYELSETGVVEAPNTQIIPELQADVKRRDSSSSQNIWTLDPVPGYDADGPAASFFSPTADVRELEAEVLEPIMPRSGHQVHSQQLIPVTEAPTSVSNADGIRQDGQACERLVCEGPLEPLDQPDLKLSGAQQQEQQDQRAKEALMALLMLVVRKISVQDVKQLQTDGNVAGFKIVGRKRYETETDVEPSNPSGTTEIPSLRVKTSSSSLRRRKAVTNPKSRKQIADLTSSDEGHDHYDSKDEPQPLHQRKSAPNATPVNAGKEAILTSLLRAQAEMLGPEHSLTCRARHKRPRTPSEWTQRRTSQLLTIFSKGERLAKNTLGQNHPHVETFSADLRSFEQLIARSNLDKAEELLNQLGKQVSRKSISPISPGTRSEEDQGHDKASSSSINISPVETGLETKASNPTSSTALPDALEKTDDSTSTPYNTAATTSNNPTDHEIPAILTMPFQPPSPTAVFTGLVIAAVSDLLINTLKWLRLNFGPEPALEPGKYRVRWTCSCGESLYDDFTELKPGAGRRLEAMLNRPRAHTSGGDGDGDGGHDTDEPPVSPQTSTDTGSFDPSPTGTASSHTSWSSAGALPSSQNPKPPSLYPGGPTTFSPTLYHRAFHPISSPPYLLTCTSEDRHITRMTHIDVGADRITSDKRLAQALRAHHAAVDRRRAWWRRALRLRGLSGIDFVQFEVHLNRFADIRKCPDLPSALPQRADYDFQADTLPPVGSKFLLHMFRHPEDYDREIMAYARVPKRTAGELRVGVGWGLNLVEDFLAERVANLVAGLVFFASLAFAVAWAFERHDVQGAFGVAQWISGTAVFVCMWVQLYVG